MDAEQIAKGSVLARWGVGGGHAASTPECIPASKRAEAGPLEEKKGAGCRDGGEEKGVPVGRQ